MKGSIARMTSTGVHIYVSGGRLKVRGEMNDVQRQYIKNHRDELKAVLPVDVDKYMKVLAVGLPVDHTYLADKFFTPEDLTLISLGDYLGGEIERYRDQIRQHLSLYEDKLT